MPSLRLSRRQKAALAVALALLLWAPAGISTHDQTLVTGHSTFYNGSTYDQCLASVAGLIRSRVMWFNDQVLVETYGKKGTFVYVTEANATNPTTGEKSLYSEGVYYDFVDPNGAHWHVEEAFMVNYIEQDESLKIDPNRGPSGRVDTDNVEGSAGLAQDRTYVWIVELADRPVYDMFAGDDPHSLYNFLVLVDTCKMKRTNSQPQGTEHYNVTHDTPEELSTRRGHVAGETEHYHEAHEALLWFGTRPVLTPLGATAVGGQTYDSSWASAYPEAHASGANLTQSTNNGPSNDAPSYWNESRSSNGQLDG